MKIIQLSKGYSAMVDDEDYEFLSQWRWYADVTSDGGVYARRREIINGVGRVFSMHRTILRLPEKGQGVDHRDRNSLNNQKENLRLATDHQNGGNRDANKNNTSGFKGVTWCKAAQKWQAQITVHRKHNYLGLFEDPVEAAKVYDANALVYFGEFAATNRMLGRIS